eukprot:6001779-Prymnesium_polylepis.2
MDFVQGDKHRTVASRSPAQPPQHRVDSPSKQVVGTEKPMGAPALQEALVGEDDRGARDGCLVERPSHGMQVAVHEVAIERVGRGHKEEATGRLPRVGREAQLVEHRRSQRAAFADPRSVAYKKSKSALVRGVTERSHLELLAARSGAFSERGVNVGHAGHLCCKSQCGRRLER